MAIKDLKDYYNKVTADYITMKDNLKQLEECISEDQAKAALYNIDELREDVAKLGVNYRRLSYVMYLLNQPTKKQKHARYAKSEQKKLANIPYSDTMQGVLDEDNDIIKRLKNYL